MNPNEQFQRECANQIEIQGRDYGLNLAAQKWMRHAHIQKYSYHFSWLGRPIIQYPQDILAMQEIIWATQPDLIIETGIAHGGSLIFYASMLELNAICGGPAADARVLGIDIDIRAHNRAEIEKHPMFRRITMVEGSSVDPGIIKQTKARAAGKKSVLVCLDSDHTSHHVLAELKAYAPLVTRGNYCVVFDTIIDNMPPDAFLDRPWGEASNPKIAVDAYLANHSEFEVDRQIDNKLLISVAPSGYLRRK